MRSAIPRETLLEHLALADRHIVQGAAIIDNQKSLILGLERDGHDTSKSRALLQQFEEIQQLHIEDRIRLAAELQRS